MTDLCPEEIGQFLGAFAERAESWKAEHAEAMRCRDLEDILLLGLRCISLSRSLTSTGTKRCSAAKSSTTRPRSTR